MPRTLSSVIKNINQNKWELIVTREISLLDLYFSAEAYLMLPSAFDTVAISNKGSVSRYLNTNQTDAVKKALNKKGYELMVKAREFDNEMGQALKRRDIENDLEELFSYYRKSWFAEILGFYVGHFCNDTRTHSIAGELRGTKSAQHKMLTEIMPRVFKKVLKAKVIPKELGLFVLPNELLADKVDIAKIKTRAEKYALVNIGKDLSVFCDNEAVKLEKLVNTESGVIEKVSVVHGSVGNHGFATGKVVIINSINDIPKVKTGDILVSIMTRTNILPAMKKAAAFVTDEGGITCHAAIVARELNKPCVIGTKKATKVFKDGDMVMVEANDITGTVSKIS